MRDAKFGKPAETVDDFLPGHAGPCTRIVVHRMALANARRRKAIEHFVETTVVIRLRADEVEPARYRFRFGQKRPPAAGIACNALEHGIGIAAEPDRQMRLLHRLGRSEEHTSELQSLMRISYAVFCLKKKTKQQ